MCDQLKPECADCGKSYQDFGLDTVLSNKQWLMIIYPEKDGLLCASCIVKRASKLPGAIRTRLIIDLIDDMDENGQPKPEIPNDKV